MKGRCKRNGRVAVTVYAFLDYWLDLRKIQNTSPDAELYGDYYLSFDVLGGWRTRYRALGEGAKEPGNGKSGQPFAFRYAQAVDAAGALPDGRKFQDVRESKRLLLADERKLRATSSGN